MKVRHNQQSTIGTMTVKTLLSMSGYTKIHLTLVSCNGDATMYKQNEQERIPEDILDQQVSSFSLYFNKLHDGNMCSVITANIV